VSNKCYKSYIFKKTLTKLEEKSSKATEELEGDELFPTPSVSRATRARIAPRDPSSTDIPASEKICTVCGNIKQKGDRQKFRICEDIRTEKLLKASVFFQDEGQVTFKTFTLSLGQIYIVTIMCHNSITGGHINFILGIKHEDDPPPNE